MKIYCDIDLYNSIQKVDFGMFYIKSGEKFFPYKLWNDFSLSILNYWISEVIDNNDCCNAAFSVHFMEGPYYLLLEKKEDWVIISGKKEDGIFENAFLEKITFSELKQVLFETASLIVAKMKELHIPSENRLNASFYKNFNLLGELLSSKKSDF